MWRPWGKSTTRIHSASSSHSFSCSSFKDIQTLCLDEPPQQPSPSATRKSNVFHRVRLANSLLRTWSTLPHHHQQQQQQQQQPPPKLPRTVSEPAPNDSLPEPSPALSPAPEIYLPGTEQRVVVYFTSLRVVRPTFEGCKSVLSILHGFRVRIDERDVSMDSGFTTELTRVMGRTGLTLPRVFIGGRYVGGAEEVRQMNEVGELKKLLEALPAVDPAECHVCAGHRFVLCDECDGSRKVYTEKAGFRACIACNENGLVRCPSCFDAPVLS